MAKGIKNIGASVRARLLNLSNANGQSFDLVLTRLALGRPRRQYFSVARNAAGGEMGEDWVDEVGCVDARDDAYS